MELPPKVTIFLILLMSSLTDSFWFSITRFSDCAICCLPSLQAKNIFPYSLNIYI